MIYRIAIYRTENGQRVFDHYATPEEMKYLRVNADGKVEIIESADSRSELPSPNLPCFETGEWFADDDYYSGSIYSQWIDVSSTHEVEWGFVQNNKPYYVNDRLESENEETIYYDTRHQGFAIGCRWLELRGENGETEICCDVCNIFDDCGKVIGTVHEGER